MKKMIGFLSLALATTLGVALMAAGRPSHAQSFNVTVTVTGHAPEIAGGPRDYFMTFSAPVAIPKANLKAGTYIFTAVAPTVVRVTSTDRNTVYSMFLTRQVSRLTTTDPAEVRFRKGADGEPPRIVAVYREYSSDGYEPIYPASNHTPRAQAAPPTR
jgi:hypothetical protein